jgi:hypothetical protein
LINATEKRMKSKVRGNGCPENKHPQDKAPSKDSNAEEPQAPHQNSYHHQSMFVTTYCIDPELVRD